MPMLQSDQGCALRKDLSSHNNAPFFIVGSGRSGSTLLRVILGQHSRIVIPPETWFLMDLVRVFGVGARLQPHQVQEAVHILTSHYRWPDFNFDSEIFREQALALDQPNIQELANVVYSSFQRKANRPRWGDKTPPYIKIVPELARLYPGSKFINLIRDGHDVIPSFVKNEFCGRWMVENVGEWRSSIRLAERWRRQFSADRFLDIRYEDLVVNTRDTVLKICKFLNEEPEPAMFEWEDSVRERVPERELHIHQKVFRKPAESDVFRWKRELSNAEVLKIESFVGPELELAGYERRFRGIWSPVLLGVRLFWEQGFQRARPIIRALRRVSRSSRQGPVKQSP